MQDPEQTAGNPPRIKEGDEVYIPAKDRKKHKLTGTYLGMKDEQRGIAWVRLPWNMRLAVPFNELKPVKEPVNETKKPEKAPKEK